MADFFDKIVYTDSTGEEITLDQSTSVVTVDASDLSVAEAQHAVNADRATNADNATKATADGNGNNIASTYATKSALSSGLAGKANTSGTYPNMTVGNATNATRATNDGSGHPILSFFTNSLTIDDLSSDAALPTQTSLMLTISNAVSPSGVCAAAYALTAKNDAYYSSNITANVVNGYLLKVMFTDTMGVQLFAPPQPSMTAKMIVTAIGGFPLSGTEFSFTALRIR